MENIHSDAFSKNAALENRPSCSQVLRSGKRCKNRSKYGNYCILHTYKGPPLLLELHDDVIYNILRCISNPKDLGNFALVSPHIQFLTSCHITNMIKNELLFVDPVCFNSTVKIGMLRHDVLYAQEYFLAQKWNYLLFLAIGGLYTKFKFKQAGNKFIVNNKIISVQISDNWMKKNSQQMATDNKLVFCINIRKVTSTIVYKCEFQTTDFETIEQFFWKHCLD